MSYSIFPIDHAAPEKTVQVIKIDVEKRQVYRTTIVDSLQGMYNCLQVSMIECPLQLDNQDCLYVDEEALLKDLKGELPRGFFCSDFPNQVLFGNGMFVGLDEEGNNCDVKSTLEEITRKITFPSQEALNRNWSMITGDRLR